MPAHILSGFLVVKRFEALYRDFASTGRFDRAIYALPVGGTGPDRVAVQYRGLDRDAIRPWRDKPWGDKEATSPRIRMAELLRAMLDDPAFTFDGQEDFLRNERDAHQVLKWAEEEAPGDYEISWARVAGAPDAPPSGYQLLGYEPTYFVSDHFSPLCDCMCFPRWHGTDEEGSLFLDYFERLNPCGLFDDKQAAESFVAHYLSFDWTEQEDYLIAEVWAPPTPPTP